MPRPVQSTPHQQEIRLLYRILSHRLFRRMLLRQGIDLTESWWRGFDTMIFRALHRCAACPGRDACRRWLVETHPGENCPRFCPNGAVIEACRILNPRAAPARPDEIEIAGRREAPIAELLEDPIVRQLMEADRADSNRAPGAQSRRR